MGRGVAWDLVAALTAAFNEPEHADVRLHFNNTAADQPPSCAPSHARSYFAHTLVLSAQSAYFKVRGMLDRKCSQLLHQHRAIDDTTH